MGSYKLAESEGEAVKEIRLIDIREEILSDNQNLADEIRKKLRDNGVFMLNLMSAPGSGKTSLIIETIRRLKDEFRLGVIEGDINFVDSRRSWEGIPAVSSHRRRLPS